MLLWCSIMWGYYVICTQCSGGLYGNGVLGIPCTVLRSTVRVCVRGTLRYTSGM